MYRLNEIIRNFSSLVGWKGVSELEHSDSGLYFQEAHPLLTLRAMRGVMPSDLHEDYPSYERGRIYDKGVRVKHLGKVYESLVGNNDYTLESDYWKEVDLFVDYLKGITERGIKKVITRFANEKTANMESRNLVDKRTLFDGAGRKENRNVNQGRIVGFEITPIRANGVTTTIDKVGVQFVGNTGSLTLYLFHSSRSEPISTKVLNYTDARGGFMWFDLSWALPYVTENTNAGGSWYIVYDENEIAPYMESVNFGRDWSREPCGSCNKGDAQLYRLMTKYITFSPFYVANGCWDGNLWDIADNIYCNGNNFGLNFMCTMSCDITDAILAEKQLFASAIQLQVASESLRTIALNPEVSVNRTQVNADRNNILFELEGNGEGIRGLIGELNKAYKALEIDTKGLDPICLGCRNKGIRFSSI